MSNESWCTEHIRAVQMVRFIPALVHIEKVCEQRFYSPRSMIMSFGQYVDKKTNSEDHTPAFLKFFDWTRDIGRTIRDFENISLMWLDQPDLSREIRTRQEWNGKPWPREVLADSGQMDLGGYLEWEQERSEEYLDYARRFMGN